MGSLSAGLGFAQCPELGQCVVVQPVVLAQWKGQDCKMGAKGKVGQQQLSLGWADVAVEFHRR